MTTNTTPHEHTPEGAECPFCDTSRIKSVVNDYGDIIAFEPLNPVVKGHLLVVPKKHVTDFTEDIDVTARVMQQAALIAGYLGGSYNLITSKGRAATQSVFHLHVHLVPRTPDDNLTLPWTDLAHQRQQAVAEFAGEVVEALEEYRPVVDNEGKRVTTDGFVDTIKSVARTLAQKYGVNLE